MQKEEKTQNTTATPYHVHRSDSISAFTPRSSLNPSCPLKPHSQYPQTAVNDVLGVTTTPPTSFSRPSITSTCPFFPLVMPLPGTILLPNSTTMVKKLNKLPPAHISLTLTHPTGTGTIQNIRMQHLQSNRLKRYMRPHRRTALQHPIPKQPTPTLHVVEGRKNQRREPQARQYEHGDDEIESRATNKSAVESKSANNHVDSSLIARIGVLRHEMDKHGEDDSAGCEVQKFSGSGCEYWCLGVRGVVLWWCDDDDDDDNADAGDLGEMERVGGVKVV
ncbi:hypothetical protein J3E74DRAFT_446874 [Bipolaris maydis]|nr:hypothetical protein J3E74DRAFT_446874 [Bipolaris maydis]